MLPEFVWDTSMPEDNPLTYPEVQMLLDGITVGGRKISDQDQVLNLAAGSKQLLVLVKAGQFEVTKAIFTELHSIVARNEALEWGYFGVRVVRRITPPMWGWVSMAGNHRIANAPACIF